MLKTVIVTTRGKRILSEPVLDNPADINIGGPIRWNRLAQFSSTQDMFSSFHDMSSTGQYRRLSAEDRNLFKPLSFIAQLKRL